jgi:hypothetical protein
MRFEYQRVESLPRLARASRTALRSCACGTARSSASTRPSTASSLWRAHRAEDHARVRAERTLRALGADVLLEPTLHPR